MAPTTGRNSSDIKVIKTWTCRTNGVIFGIFSTIWTRHTKTFLKGIGTVTCITFHGKCTKFIIRTVVIHLIVWRIGIWHLFFKKYITSLATCWKGRAGLAFFSCIYTIVGRRTRILTIFISTIICWSKQMAGCWVLLIRSSCTWLTGIFCATWTC